MSTEADLPKESGMVAQPDVLLVFFVTVSGENGDLLGTDESSIVQIHWIAIDVKTNKVEREGAYIISQLDENGNITGDVESETQSQGNSLSTSQPTIAKNLKDCLEQLAAIIEELSFDSRVVGIVTENQLHLRQGIFPRAFKMEFEVPLCFYTFFDVRKEYRKFTMSTTPFRSLKDIADDMTIKKAENLLVTTESRCRFCSKVVQHLLKEGHKFSHPETVTRTLDMGPATGFVKDDTIVRARGLPWQVSDCDVANFFTGLNITKGGVALCLNLKGRRNGEALVRLETSEHRDMALKRHKHHLFGRYIEVYKGTAQDFLKLAKGPASAMNTAATFLSNGGEVIIRIRGLPFDAVREDIVDFFGESPKVHQGKEGVLLVLHPDGSSTGDAFVLFNTEQEGQMALKKHRENIGKRYVELFRSTRAELQQVLTMYNVGFPVMNPASPMAGLYPNPSVMTDRALINQRLQALMNMSCIRMRGLPFSASTDDIMTFLAIHAKNIIGVIHIIYNLQGRPSGEAVVQLHNPEQAHKCANDLHLKHMGERYIEVFQCCVQDMTWMLATSHANQLAAQHMNHINTNANHHGNSPVHLANVHMNHSRIPQTTPPPPPPPITTITTTAAPPQMSNIMVPPKTCGFLATPVPAVPIYTGQFPLVSPVPGAFIPQHAVPTVMGAVYNPESLHFQVNQFGKPSGVAYITFATPEEAQRAVLEKDRHPMGHRYVEMFMA